MSPQLVARTSDITVTITVPEGTERADEKMVMPGDNVDVVCEVVHDFAADVSQRFLCHIGYEYVLKQDATAKETLL